MNKPITTVPIEIALITTVLAQPLSDAILNPYRNEPNPTEDKTIDNTSIFGFRRSVTFRRKSPATVTVIATIGRTVINKERHEKCSNSQPDSVGPIAGPNAITIPIILIAEPRHTTEMTDKSTVIKSGSIIPDPEA